MKRTILVTGAHRSGTTFVGSILREASGVVYVQEPFNPHYDKVHSLSRNSRNLSSFWKKAFSENQIKRIMELAGSPAAKHYPQHRAYCSVYDGSQVALLAAQ